MLEDVRVGLLLVECGDWSRLIERVLRYEDIGVDVVWVPDHFVFPWDPDQPWLDGWALLAALAARTSRIRLGPLVTHALYRNPAVIARTAMTVDQISDGRLELGIGTGASDYDWTMPTGMSPWSFAERVERVSEVIAIVDGLLRGELGAYTGRFYQVQDAVLAPGPVQRPRPRLLIAASGPRMVRLAARHGDAWVTEGAYRELWGHPAKLGDVLDITRERVEQFTDAAAANGRDPSALGRVFLAGFSAGTETPWASSETVLQIVAQFGALGFREFVFPEPRPTEWATFAAVMADRLDRRAAY